MSTNDDYLWDPSAPVDPEVARLEHALGEHRWRERPWSERDGARRPMLRIAALAAGALVVLGAGAWWLGRTVETLPAPYALETLAGAPRVDERAAPAPSATPATTRGLVPGQRIVCDAGSRARLSVGTIGSVELEPGTELALLDPDALEDGARFALRLERGAIAARITSAPRVFQVGTPAGIAVDMGCIYRASVDERGRTHLGVDGGMVAFSGAARRIVVPAGASAWADPAGVPSTPLWDDADAELRAAVEAFDAGAGEPGALVQLAARSDGDPTLVLWNLLGHPRTAVRALAYDALALRVPPPQGLERAGLLAGDREALDRWRAALDWSW